MTYRIDYWDLATQSQKQRDATPAEAAEFDALKGAAPPQVPQEVPMLNAHLALIQAGKMDQVKALVTSLPDMERLEAEAYLNLAQTCRRDNKWVISIGAGLGYDAAGLDSLFRSAAAMNP